MMQRRAAARFATLVTIAALLSTLIGTTIAEARDGGWQPAHSIADGPQLADGGRRPDRSVNVADLRPLTARGWRSTGCWRGPGRPD